MLVPTEKRSLILNVAALYGSSSRRDGGEENRTAVVEGGGVTSPCHGAIVTLFLPRPAPQRKKKAVKAVKACKSDPQPFDAPGPGAVIVAHGITDR